MEKQDNMLAVIERAALNPEVDVEKFQQLLNIKKEMMALEAEVAFNESMARLQPQLPQIKHDAQIRHGNKVISSYATYEAIDEIIRPLYTAEGFSVSFDSQPLNGGVVYSAKLSHVAGHSRSASMILPADVSGAKNAIQAIGSTTKYAMRYLVGMLFNLVTIGEDDDGAGIGYITFDEAVEIDNLIVSVSADKPRFLAHFGIETVRELPAKRHAEAVAMLKRKAKP